MASNIAKELAEEEVKPDMTPIIDVTFNLLIFFMCSLKFKTLEGKLVSFLPTDRGLAATPSPIETEDAEIILRIARGDLDKPPLDRAIVILRNGSNEPFAKILKVQRDEREPKNVQMLLDPPDTFERVKAYLDKVRASAPDTKAKINADPAVPHMHVVNTLNMMIAAQFTDISYSGIPATLIEKLMKGEIK